MEEKMSKNNKSGIRKVLKGYNYWRPMLGLSSRPKRKKIAASQCQVACHSDPCTPDPTCDFD
jgi:hypothetical protein